jgi:opacity protein-like surface antigen
MLDNCCKNFMPYLAGGYASASYTDQIVRGPGGFAQQPILWSRDRYNGWYIGGGVDMALAQNWTLGFEYRHYEFDDVAAVPSCAAQAAAGGAIATCNTIGQPFPLATRLVDVGLDTVSLRLSWKFGRPEPAPLK